ncbi:E3 ubiquitin-protein ligase Praja-2 isoform X2 [Abrus precatorius]|uniref:E3 ubiquitin-protein ligase Praja-2 isoform X2 n=1 Tax=Abrus precatorius TaxID=3816 RepID=A0A8B8MAI1_ABRPR|nr:E3 ubiquitin-protein ligase Praja-2 isoform X2 [Abrus precatorius]
MMKEMEEDMEIDHIVDIPDTPDRIIYDQKYFSNPEKRERGFTFADEMNNGRNYINLSPSEKSCPSQNAPIFRRAQTEKLSGLGTTHLNGTEKMEKGKAIGSKFPSKSSRHGPISVLDLTEENGQFQQLKPALSHHGSRYNATEDKKESKASIGNSSLPFYADSSNTSRNAFTGKGKLDNKTLPGPKVSVDRGKSISLPNDSQSQSPNEKQVSLPPCLSTAPQCRGHKRLVRNGCISPHNIATRAKQSAKQSSHQTKSVEQSQAGHSVSSNTVSLISVDDTVAEERGSGRAKGKEVLTHPSSHGLHATTFHTNSSPVINCEEANSTLNALRNSFQYTEGQGGWRTTHNERNADQQLYNVNGLHSRRNCDTGRFINRRNISIMDKRNTGNSQSSNDVHTSLLDHSAQPTSVIIPDVDQSTGTHHTADILTKRQRKRESPSGNPNDASYSYNSEVMFLSSSGESSSSSRSPVLDPEVVELLSTPGFANRSSEDVDDNDKNILDARARQVEADEILARELQEQLYHDDFFEGRGIDEHLAWEPQHAEDLLHTSIDSHDIYHPTWFPRANRQPRSRSHQNPSNRRRNVPQASFSNRMLQSRSRIANQPPIISSRGRRPQFPLDMDLDMRLDILEALEDAVGDFSDMGMADDIFHTRRDFNEDDYEMLLALDEGNHQHTGASAYQINSLPQSTVQTDNFAEACAICLETPVKGESIRHLPCLHKFHKDCIDPWLRRKTSCPVCKSSIA